VCELECSDFDAYLVAVEQLNVEDGGINFWLKTVFVSLFCSGLYLLLKLPQNGCSVIVVI